ncbi:response regulator [Pseudanabaena sp. FACHB-1277]|uniref:Response regulator n=1 Tax=Pseudanabaena cinerea FACHB-1277 TaxID=2949581 RepID=A0A926UQF9_9CYAN|nr:response regulator [Pseudanabaena cinerea]MBD2149132.1 response regulator [Pseudanabaena cinerea FACHB-1277]
MDTDSLAVYSLLEQLRGYSRKQFTGKLELYAVRDYKWSIYYCHGRLVWAAGGEHHYRRWYRLLLQHRVQVDLGKISFRTAAELALWDYYVLVIMMRRMVITRDQVSPVIESFIHEVLFDVIQWAAKDKISYYCDFEDEVTPVIALIHADNAINQAHNEWLVWRKAGIADFSPNLAPWVKRPGQLQEEASELTYKTLITILDGRRSLRELSVWLKKDLLTLMQSLMAYYYRGMVGLAEVADIASPIANPFATESVRSPLPELVKPQMVAENNHRTAAKPASETSFSRPLIACVDDSNQVCATLEQIVSALGYGFLGIKDSIKVLPLLVEHRPEMIILDLVMPIVGGYELCSQIRRIPEFHDTPILILTSNDTIIDRVRAKFVGATSFISKTVGNEKIGEKIQRYLIAPQIMSNHVHPFPPKD